MLYYERVYFIQIDPLLSIYKKIKHFSQKLTLEIVWSVFCSYNPHTKDIDQHSSHLGSRLDSLSYKCNNYIFSRETLMQKLQISFMRNFCECCNLIFFLQQCMHETEDKRKKNIHTTVPRRQYTACLEEKLKCKNLLIQFEVTY